MDHLYYNLNQTNPLIVYAARGDVNGDKIPDNVYLTGIRTPDSPFIQNITLVIQDGRTGQFARIPLSSDAGYNPTLFLGDFTGNGVQDIMISIASGGSGGMMYYYIYSYMMNKPQLIFDYNVFNETYQYDVIYRDYYKVEVIDRTNQQKYIIDISQRGREYLSEIYNRNGRLKQPIRGFVNPLSGLYPVDFDSNGVYELLAYQRIAGRYNADSLGNVETTLKWDKRQFTQIQQVVSVFGSQA
ncbi:spore coat protein [Geosporobacter ferrireducens]|uniref:Spore coat protein n=1 Tax=Geosporobacter ferrireducens TaxID=1424294 RepID=A0A1D8GMI2_9FIRM|nr:spore coat protein [Geosporobacter ferrireducens]AOT72117.1 spore coat protein [Geosporobacter ferrireducens]MTI56006.1 VCBS repeat-containing protein [Geosporobacter ferrireducens]